MRDILFKAKRLSDGAWVEGYLYRLHDSLNPFIMLRNRHGEAYEVDPSTVCEYTGLTNRNRKKIFEGDIILVEEGEPHELTNIGMEPAVITWSCAPSHFK